MPQLGETVTEGTITRWMKQVGEPVAEDEVLFEVSTDKVDSEVPSPVAGVLTEILVPEGDTVDVGTRLAVISSDDAAAAGTPTPAPEPPTSAQEPPTPAPEPPTGAPPPEAPEASRRRGPPAGARARAGAATVAAATRAGAGRGGRAHSGAPPRRAARRRPPPRQALATEPRCCRRSCAG